MLDTLDRYMGGCLTLKCMIPLQQKSLTLEFVVFLSGMTHASEGCSRSHPGGYNHRSRAVYAPDSLSPCFASSQASAVLYRTASAESLRRPPIALPLLDVVSQAPVQLQPHLTTHSHATDADWANDFPLMDCRRVAILRLDMTSSHAGTTHFLLCSLDRNGTLRIRRSTTS